MIRRGVSTLLDRGWRRLATGTVILLFGLGAIILSLTMFPLLRLGRGGRAGARARIQRSMQVTFFCYAKLMKSLGLLTFEVHGSARLRSPGQLVIANHPTLIDVVMLVSLMPQVDCIVKEGLWRNPFLRWPVTWAAYIPNRSGEALVEECTRVLRGGHSLLVFPEGTRTVPGQPLHLKRGVSHIALAALVPVLPVTITVSEPLLTKGYPWYRVPRRRPHMRIVVGEPWRPEDYNVGSGAGPQAARALTKRIAVHYAEVDEQNLQWLDAGWQRYDNKNT